LPDDLIKASEERKLIVFLGAGISCAVGLRDWDSIKRELIDKLKPLPNDPENLKEQLESEEPYECFAELSRREGRTFNRTLDRALRSRGADLTKFKQLLSSLMWRQLLDFCLSVVTPDGFWSQTEQTQESNM